MTATQLVDAYPVVRAFIRRRLSQAHRDVADDLVQDTMLAVCLALSRRPGAVPLDSVAYMLQVAYNKLQDHLRASYRFPHGSLDEVPEGRLATVIQEAFDDIGQSEAKLLAEIASALRTLDVRSIRVLAFRFVDGLSNGETAEKLGITPAEVSRVKYRAIDALRKRAQA